MTMNLVHRVCCRSGAWARYSREQLVPWALEGVDLGAHTVEIGPGYGANLPALRARTDRVTGVEIDPELAARLRAREPEVSVRTASGLATGLTAGSADSVVCFTMLHHVPSPAEQDALFAGAYRILAPGGVLAGSDGLDSAAFRLIHLGDTCVPVPPQTLPDRLAAAGFTDIRVDVDRTSLRFRGVRPISG